MSNQSIAQLPLPVEGVDLAAQLSITIPAPATEAELEALRWFVGQQPGETLAAIQRAHEDHQYWQQRAAQAAFDGGW